MSGDPESLSWSAQFAFTCRLCRVRIPLVIVTCQSWNKATHSIVQPWALCTQHQVYVIKHYSPDACLWCRPAGHFQVLAQIHFISFIFLHVDLRVCVCVCRVSVYAWRQIVLSLSNSPFLTWADSRCRCWEEQPEKALRTSPHIKHLEANTANQEYHLP